MTNPTGKGLAALLGEIEKTANEISNDRFSTHTGLAMHKIVAGKQQPRQVFTDDKMEDLVDSIRKNGVLQPIIVRKLDEDMFEIIAGERRYRASKIAERDSIPAVIISCSNTEALQIGLIENLQRDDLNPMDEAEAYLRLTQEYNKTQDEIARAVSKSRSYIANQIRLTTLPPQIKELVRAKLITSGHARNLINNPDALTIADRIMNEGLNVRETEAIRQQQNQGPLRHSAKQNFSEKQQINKDPSDQNEAVQLAQKLQEHLGIKTKITTYDTGGTLSFYFTSFEQLDELMQKLGT